MTERIHTQLRQRITSGAYPAALTQLSLASVGWASTDLIDVFRAQVESRALDLASRQLGREKRTFYSIGSSGHEGNAAAAHALRVTDMAFLHYRSGAFLLERLRKAGVATPMWDMALSFAAAKEDPVSGGRHKVLGSVEAFVPPQTSTIASHLPKAVGFAHAIALARTLRKSDSVAPHDAVSLVSFGDASLNHSTAQGALNAAAWAAHRKQPLPIIFLCEDNGIGISVPTPAGWVEASASARPGIAYIKADGRDIVDVARAFNEAQGIARARRRPVFVHMRAVRLMGHAGSDVESAYRERAAIEADEADDPLLHSARRLVESGALSWADVLSLYDDACARALRVMEAACARPKLTTPEEVAAPITPSAGRNWRGAAQVRPSSGEGLDVDTRHARHPLARAVSLALQELMQNDADALVFGEDVARKGGVYGATFGLHKRFGPARVFDTLLDEQTILGLAIGLAQNGFLPIPEIQFLAYLHNAEDQIRGEAATASFFSQGAFVNPMIIRIAGLGYQKGFGGHFHNDNALGVLRDIPGVMLACPSSANDAIGLMREAWRLARQEGRVVVFLEPIALYGARDLHVDGDEALLGSLESAPEHIAHGALGVHGDGADLVIVSYANGCVLSQQAQNLLERDHGVRAQVIDLRWLSPLPIEAVRAATAQAGAVLVVDECRRTGSVSEELITGLVEGGCSAALARVTARDTFIPLGPAATAPLPSVEQIVAGALEVSARARRGP